MTLDALHLAILVLAGMGGGFANSLAGGGTLLTFPALLAAGLPPVTANITSTVSLCPGYLGGILAQLRDLKGQGRRLAMLVPVSMIGSVAGGWLLLRTGERSFVALVPWLLLMACALMAGQDRIRRWLAARATRDAQRCHPHLTSPIEGGGTITAMQEERSLPFDGEGQGGVTPPGERRGADNFAVAIPTLGIAAIYGGYFGPGVSVMFMAVLGLVLVDTLTRLNALKSALGLAVNLGAALFFIGSGRIVWPAVGAVAAGALVGGALGGRLAGAIRPATLRTVIVTVGVGVAAVLLVRG